MSESVFRDQAERLKRDGAPAYWDRDDAERITDRIAEWLDWLAAQTVETRDRIAAGLDAFDASVLTYFLWDAGFRAERTGDARWPRRGLRVLAMLATLPIAVARTIAAEIDDRDSELGDDAVAADYQERHVTRVLATVPLWAAEQLGFDLAALCRAVAAEASTAGGAYLLALAERPDLRFVARPLAERFGDAGFAPIAVGGVTAYPRYRRTVRPGERISVTFLGRNADTDQALVLDVRDQPGARIIAGNERTGHRSAIFWYDRWAGQDIPTVEVAVAGDVPRIALVVSNAWRLPDGTTGEWLGNYGMAIEEDGDRVVLRCSDGHGPPRFDNLVAELRFHGEQAPQERQLTLLDAE